MDAIWKLKEYKGKIALIDEYGNNLTYDNLNSEADALAKDVYKRQM